MPRKKKKDILKQITDIEQDNVLVACPTYKGKSYSLEAYISAYNNFTYPHKGLFMVDNTGDGMKYFEHLKSLKVPCDYVPPDKTWQKTFAMCWKRITREAKDKGYRWVASIEADNICPPLTLDALLNVAGFTRSVHVAHSYLWHEITQAVHNTPARLIGLGCNLILTDLLVEVFKQKKWPSDSFEAEIYAYPQRHGMTTIEIHNMLDVRHSEARPGDEYYIFDREECMPQFVYGQTINRALN